MSVYSSYRTRSSPAPTGAGQRARSRDTVSLGGKDVLPEQSISADRQQTAEEHHRRVRLGVDQARHADDARRRWLPGAETGATSAAVPRPRVAASIATGPFDHRRWRHRDQIPWRDQGRRAGCLAPRDGDITERRSQRSRGSDLYDLMYSCLRVRSCREHPLVQTRCETGATETPARGLRRGPWRISLLLAARPRATSRRGTVQTQIGPRTDGAVAMLLSCRAGARGSDARCDPELMPAAGRHSGTRREHGYRVAVLRSCPRGLVAASS